MSGIKLGKIQLPDIQRGWVWEDERIIAIIASITNNFPVGAAMFLEYGNEMFVLNTELLKDHHLKVKFRQN